LTVIVDIPLSNLDPLMKRAGRHAARARAHGMPDVGLRILERIDRRVDVPDQFERLRGNLGATRQVALPVVRVELKGTAPWIGQWKVVGRRHRVRRKGKPNLVLSYGDVPGGIAAREMCCDHCGTARDRAVTYSLVREDGRREVEVGASCLADFVGSPGDERILEGIECVSAILREVHEATDPYWRHGGEREVLEEARLVMAVANRIIQDEGWISGAQARRMEVDPTWRTVASALELSRSEDVLRVTSQSPLGADFMMADDAIAWVKCAERDQFMAEVAQAIEVGMAGRKEIAMLCAGVAMYRRHLLDEELRRREEVQARLSVHVGEEKERFETVVAVRRVFPFQSQWGGGFVALMNDADGNMLSWTTGRHPGMEPGHCYEIKGTVKKHGTVRSGAAEGAPETQLTRVVILADLGPGQFDAPAPALTEADIDSMDSQIFAPPGL